MGAASACAKQRFCPCMMRKHLIWQLHLQPSSAGSTRAVLGQWCCKARACQQVRPTRQPAAPQPGFDGHQGITGICVCCPAEKIRLSSCIKPLFWVIKLLYGEPLQCQNVFSRCHLHASCKASICCFQEQLESNLTKVTAENAQLASRVHQLETQCSSLEGTAKDAEQQQRHDHCYQDELLADRQQATQVCRVALQKRVQS